MFVELAIANQSLTVDQFDFCLLVAAQLWQEWVEEADGAGVIARGEGSVDRTREADLAAADSSNQFEARSLQEDEAMTASAIAGSTAFGSRRRRSRPCHVRATSR